jgi:hypothetical protein
MIRSEARVVTDRPGRYIAQLCKHFAHKVESTFTEDAGFANFGWGTCTLTATEGALLLRAQAPDEEGIGRVEYVVADHTERFGARDELKVVWVRDGGPAATP